MRPVEHDDIQVLVDGEWLPGELRGWKRLEDGWWAHVTYNAGPSDNRPVTVPASQVRIAPLTDQHKAMLRFEAESHHWKYAGEREQAIRSQFDMSETRYFLMLNWVIEQAEAEALDPTTVRRLRRLRDKRAEARSSRRVE